MPQIIIIFLGDFLDLIFIYNWIVIFFPPNIHLKSIHQKFDSAV